MAYSPTLDDFPAISNVQSAQSPTLTSGYTPQITDMPTMAPVTLNPKNITSEPPSIPAQLWQSAKNSGADILSGLATAGQGLHNAPYNIVNNIENVANKGGDYLKNAFQLPDPTTNLPNLSKYVPNLINYTPAPDNTDYGQMIRQGLGATPPNIADKIAQGAIQYLPYAMVTPNVALQGLAYGATQSPNPLKDAPLDATINKGLAAIPAGVTKHFSQFAETGLGNKLSKMMDSLKNITNQQAFNLAKNNYQNYSSAEKSAWDNLTNQATNADASGAKFNNEDYLNSLSNKLEELQGQSDTQSGYARANKDSIGLLNDYMNDQHGTFTDAINHNKALNQDFQNEIAPGQPLPFRTVNFAKANLKDTINQNIADNGLQDTLGSAWNNANQLTAEKNQLFNTVVNNSGKDQISKFSSFLNGRSGMADPTSFVTDYLPTGRTDGIQKMQQFSKMLGDENAAKNTIKANYFDTAYQNNELNPKAFLNKYNNLSDEQQNYLFTPEENTTMQALNKIYASQKPGEKDLNHFMPTLMGIVVGHGFDHGLGELAGGLFGYTAGKIAKPLLNKAFSNPDIANYYANFLTKNGSGMPIAQQLLPAAITPQYTSGIAATPAFINQQQNP